MSTLIFSMLLLMVGLGTLDPVTATQCFNCSKIKLLREDPSPSYEGKTEVDMDSFDYSYAAGLLPNPQIYGGKDPLTGKSLCSHDTQVRVYEVTYESGGTEKINAIYCKGVPYDFYYCYTTRNVTHVYYAKDTLQPPHAHAD